MCHIMRGMPSYHRPHFGPKNQSYFIEPGVAESRHDVHVMMKIKSSNINMLSLGYLLDWEHIRISNHDKEVSGWLIMKAPLIKNKETPLIGYASSQRLYSTKCFRKKFVFAVTCLYFIISKSTFQSVKGHRKVQASERVVPQRSNDKPMSATVATHPW